MEMLGMLIATASLAAPGLADRLVADGYENVAVATGSLSLVAFEDRRDVDPARGMGRVARMALADPAMGPELELIVRHEGREVMGLRMRRADLAAFMAGSLEAAAFGERLVFDMAPPRLGPGANSTTGHGDLTLSPGYAFSDHLEGFLSPTWRFSLREALVLKARLRTRLYPELGIGGGYGVIGGDVPVAPGIWAGWLAGGWEVDRYGVMGSVGGLSGLLHWNLLGSVMTAQAGSARLALEYPLPWWDGFVRTGGGFYPAGDRAVYLSLGRYFSRSQVELGYYRSDFGNQLRATVSAYLGPLRRSSPGPWRFEVPGEVTVDYRATAPAGATEWAPQPETVRLFERRDPQYLKLHLESWRSEDR